MGEKELLELGRLLIDFPLPYETIRGLKISEASGGHSTLSLKLIAARPLDKADILPLEEAPIKVLTPTGENIFVGTCQSIGIGNEADYSEITISAISLSKKTDIKKNRRTFQKGSKTLEEVANTVMSSYGITVAVKDNVTIAEMLNQENETDWAFIKRIAAQFGAMLFTDSKADGLRICIGAVGFKLKSLDTTARVISTEKGIGSFTKIKHNLNKSAEAYEFATDQIESYDLTLDAGQLIEKEGAPQVIVASEIVAKRGTVTNVISLRHQEGATPSFSQTKEPVMTANILTGTVLAIQGNEIKVHFNVDGSQSPGEAMWIPYEHELNNYMYCMPDIGDTVFVYYEKQGKVVALGSKHMNADSHPDFQHPENKMLTSCNKMVKFTPNTIELVGNRKQYDGTGDAAFQAQIEFNTEQGICIYSKQDIKITTDQNIRMEALKEFITIEEPATKFDSMHDAGEATYMASGGMNVWQQAKACATSMVKNKINEVVDSFADGIKGTLTAPLQVVSSVEELFSSGEAPEGVESAEPIERFEEGVVYLMGQEATTFNVGQSYLALDTVNINIKTPLYRQLGFEKRNIALNQKKIKAGLILF